jgi:hypothetical protein
MSLMKKPQRPDAPPSDLQPMTPEQAAGLKHLAEDALEPDAYDPTLTRDEAARRIEMLTAKLKLMSLPPHVA